jgi:hypothetical protein
MFQLPDSKYFNPMDCLMANIAVALSTAHTTTHAHLSHTLYIQTTLQLYLDTNTVERYSKITRLRAMAGTSLNHCSTSARETTRKNCGGKTPVGKSRVKLSSNTRPVTSTPGALTNQAMPRSRIKLSKMCLVPYFT